MSEGNKPVPPRFRLYLDESGDHTYKNLHDPSRRFLALLGVWFRQADDYVAFADEMEAFKRRIFGPRPDKPVVLHRNDITNRRGPFGLLKQPSVEKDFNDGLLALVESAKFKLICVMIDKHGHRTNYVSPIHPYHYCLAAVLDRYSGWLNYKSVRGDVMAEGRGGREDRQLKEAYRSVYEAGTLMFTHKHHQRALTSSEIKISLKARNVAGLQLADVLAYPVKQACLVQRGAIPDPGDVFGKKLCSVVEKKFNRNEYRGNVEGYGKVWLSMAQK